MSEKLYVITVVSNPQQYKSRYRLYREFSQYMQSFQNVEFYTVELAFAQRKHEVTDASNPYHIQVRGNQEFWHKENLINIGISKLPLEAKKIAWIDADIKFLNPNWVQDTLDSLDHYQFTQMFSEYIDLGPRNEILGKATSFMYTYYNKNERIVSEYGSGLKGATGLAWAARRSAIEAIGGIPDFNIVGAGDWFLAYNLVNMGSAIIQDDLTPGYKMLLEKLSENCKKYIQNNVGYVDGLVVHYFHGKKSNRGYGWRESILRKHRFDPIFDLNRDAQGLYIVNPQKQEMLNELIEYFRSRDEDSTEI
jgi:hypothetical protein